MNIKMNMRARRLVILFTVLLLVFTTVAVFAASVGSPLDSPGKNAFDDRTIVDAVAVPDDSPIADLLVKNNGDVRVATIFLAQDTPVANPNAAGRQLIFQATDGTTKTRGNIQAPPGAATACTPELAVGAGMRFPADGTAIFSEDGALLAAEAQVREKGESNYFDVVIVWSVVPNGNSGGEAKGAKILCMDELMKMDTMRKDDGKGNSLGDQYLVVGHYQGEAASFVVGR